MDEYEDRIIFSYFPENGISSGEIEINRASGDINVLKRAENDEFSRYLHHAASEMMKYFKNNKYEKEKVLSWY